MTFSFIIDLIIIAIIVFFVFRGKRNGLIKMIFGCLTIIFALLAAKHIGPLLGNTLYESSAVSGWVDKTTVSFEDSLKEESVSAENSTDNKDIDVDKNPAFGVVSDFADMLNINLDELKADFNKSVDAANASVENGISNIGELYKANIIVPFAKSATNFFGMLIIFILAFIIISVIGFFANKLFNTKLLKRINKTGGMIAGGIYGVFFVFVLCTVMQIIVPHLSIGILREGMENETVIYRLFTSINPIYAVLFG